MSYWKCEHCGGATPVPWVESGTSSGPALFHNKRCIHCGKNPTSYSAIWASLFIVYIVLMLLFVVGSGDTIDEEDEDKVILVFAGGFMLLFCMCLLLGKLKEKGRKKRAIRRERARQRKAEQGRQNNE
jgi:hypothetical protein